MVNTPFMDSGASQTDDPLRIFCSYSHKDSDVMLRKLMPHLDKAFDNGGQKIKVFVDNRDILPGDEWRRRIGEELDLAHIFLFLLSRHLLESRFCLETEAARAFERRQDGARVIPLVISEVEIEGTPFAELQAMLIDEDGHIKPLDKWDSVDQACAAVVGGLQQILHQGSPEKARTFGLPPQPDHVYGRARFVATIADALRNDPGRPVAVTGDGASGKTTAVQEYVRTNADRYDTILWMRAETKEKFDWDAMRHAVHLGLPASDLDIGRQAFKTWLTKTDRWLLVLDNSLDPRDLARFLPPGTRGDVVVTSQKPDWGDVATPLPIWRLPHEDAVRILMDLTGREDREGADELAELVRESFVPLRNAANYMLQTGMSFTAYASLLKTQMSHDDDQE